MLYAASPHCILLLGGNLLAAVDGQHCPDQLRVNRVFQEADRAIAERRVHAAGVIAADALPLAVVDLEIDLVEVQVVRFSPPRARVGHLDDHDRVAEAVGDLSYFPGMWTV